MRLSSFVWLVLLPRPPWGLLLDMALFFYTLEINERRRARL